MQGRAYEAFRQNNRHGVPLNGRFWELPRSVLEELRQEDGFNEEANLLYGSPIKWVEEV